MHANTSVRIMKHPYSGRKQAAADWLVIGCSAGPLAGGQAELKVLLVNPYGAPASLVVKGQRSEVAGEKGEVGARKTKGRKVLRSSRIHVGGAKGTLRIGAHDDDFCTDVFFSSQLQFYYPPALRADSSR